MSTECAPPPPPLPDHLTIRRLSVLAGCHERTLIKALRGEPVRGHALNERIADVLRTHGNRGHGR